ncbi:hypothetical protein DFH08DRAFT_966147 [Mycena albidolilacea]|uniref:Uncharacterized protein n=1 Tax=Mycena albidolilacea TaxID=1033008 RepID=A0AAD6ZP93_9AGAR|nr:hypothetical protein DFH08DRAFT_966147 [Mycena albidolilacea]
MSGNKSRTTRKAKKPAAGRMAQFNACVCKGSANKENIPSISTPPSGASLLSDLTIPKIHSQLNALRLRGVLDILANSRYVRKPAKLDALEAALNNYLPHIDKYPLPPDPEADMDPETVAIEPEIVEEWEDEEDVEMED